MLEYEAHVRRTRALLARIDAARALTDQLGNSGLTPAKQQLAAEIGEQLGTRQAPSKNSRPAQGRHDRSAALRRGPDAPSQRLPPDHLR